MENNLSDKLAFLGRPLQSRHARGPRNESNIKELELAIIVLLSDGIRRNIREIVEELPYSRDRIYTTLKKLWLRRVVIESRDMNRLCYESAL